MRLNVRWEPLRELESGLLAWLTYCAGLIGYSGVIWNWTKCPPGCASPWHFHFGDSGLKVFLHWRGVVPAPLWMDDMVPKMVTFEGSNTQIGGCWPAGG